MMAHKYLSVRKFKKNELSKDDKIVCEKKIESLNLKERFGRNVRSDAVWMIEIVVTLDSTSKAKKGEFFKDCYSFLSNRYGKENCLYAMRHGSQCYPYMHYKFIPVTQDGRLSAKEVIDKGELYRLHNDFDTEIGSKWGLQRARYDKIDFEKVKMEKVDLELKKAVFVKNDADLNKECDKLKKEKAHLEAELKKIKVEQQKERMDIKNELSEAQKRAKETEMLLELIKHDLGLKSADIEDRNGTRLYLKFILYMLSIRQEDDFLYSLEEPIKKTLKDLHVTNKSVEDRMWGRNKSK